MVSRGRRDRRGRRRRGMFCRAGLWAAAPRDGSGAPDAKASTSKKTRPEAEGGPATSSLRDAASTSPASPSAAPESVAQVAAGTPPEHRLGGPVLLPTVAYAVAPALPARHRAAPRRPAAAAALRAALPRARAEPGRARRGRPALRGDPHPQGSRGRAPTRCRTSTEPAARRGSTRWRSPRARSAPWCTSSPPGCAGSASTASTTAAGTPFTTGLVTWLPEPPAADDRGGRGPRRRGRCASTRPTSRARGRRRARSRRRSGQVAYRIAERMVLDPADRQRVLDGADAATRLRTVLALLRREAAIVGRFGALPTPPGPGGASLN